MLQGSSGKSPVLKAGSPHLNVTAATENVPQVTHLLATRMETKVDIYTYLGHLEFKVPICGACTTVLKGK